ncbi:MAG: ABC transporter permease [Salinispira sp.]
MNAETKNPKKLPIFISNWQDYVIYYIFIGIFLLFSVLLFNRGFLSATNLLNIGRQSAMICILSVGMTFVLAAEEIDLSFGSIVALAAIITALVLRATDNIFLSFAAGIASGTLVGFINGLFVSKVGIPSFLVTLGMSGIVIGIARWISNLQSIAINNDFFVFLFGSGNIGPIPILFIWILLIGGIGHVTLTKTALGRKILASGGNRVSALYSGINVRQIKLIVLTINGALAGLTGILYTGRLHGARYTLGENDLLIVIAAVIIGGTSMFGGKGSVIGSIFGALIMAMLSNGLILLGLSVDQQLIFRGLIIIVSVSLAMHQRKS